jgi:hypothetical protein
MSMNLFIKSLSIIYVIGQEWSGLWTIHKKRRNESAGRVSPELVSGSFHFTLRGLFCLNYMRALARMAIEGVLSEKAWPILTN